MRSEIEIRLQKHKAESLTWQKPTDFEKLVNACDELNKERIVSLHKAGYTRQDGQDDCKEIIEELDKIGIPTKGYYFYHTQDLERAIGEERMLFIGFNSFNGEDELAKEVAEQIIEVLKKHEFNVKWNGSLQTGIEILDLNCQKTVDNIDYNYGRVFEIMKNQHTQENGLERDIKSKPFWKFW